METNAPASNVCKQAADHPILLIREFTMFNVGPQIV